MGSRLRAFNGEAPLFGVRRIPDADEGELVYEAHFRGTRATDPWVAVSNGSIFSTSGRSSGCPPPIRTP